MQFDLISRKFDFYQTSATSRIPWYLTPPNNQLAQKPHFTNDIFQQVSDMATQVSTFLFQWNKFHFSCCLIAPSQSVPTYIATCFCVTFTSPHPAQARKSNRKTKTGIRLCPKGTKFWNLHLESVFFLLFKEKQFHCSLNLGCSQSRWRWKVGQHLTRSAKLYICLDRWGVAYGFQECICQSKRTGFKSIAESS